MAGPYVHCLVSKEALKQIFNPDSGRWHEVITNPKENAPYFPYVCLGSVSPDYPYPAIRLSGVNKTPDKNGLTWGDKFHKENTGAFIDIGIQILRSEADKTTPAFLKKAAWLMGYYSHVITDLVVHAAVYVLVNGCYESHEGEHLFCEVTEDSLLFKETTGKELVDEHFLRILWKCSDGVSYPPMDPTHWSLPPLDNNIKQLWDSILKENYGDFYGAGKPLIDDWHREYVTLMSVATNIAARHLMSHMAYQKTTDITEENKIKYYSNIRLPAPDSPFGRYRTDVFEYAIGKVTEKLNVFLNAITNNASYNALKEDLKNWDLDKGTDKNPDDGNPRRFVAWVNAQTAERSCPHDGS